MGDSKFEKVGSLVSTYVGGNPSLASSYKYFILFNADGSQILPQRRAVESMTSCSKYKIA